MAPKNLGTNKWRIKVSVLDKKKGYPVGKQETFKGTRAEATIREAELLKELKSRCSLTTQQQASTFKDLIAMYRQKVETRGRCSHNYGQKLELVDRELGHLRIEGFADNFTVYCQNLSNKITNRGKLLNPGSINQYKAVVRAAFQHAVNLEILSKNPITQVKFPTSKVKPRDRVLTDEEWQRFIDVIREHKPYILPIIEYMSMVPCRVMELVSAKREQYELIEKNIYIPDSKAGIPIYKPVPDKMLNYFTNIPVDCPWLFYQEIAPGKYRPLTNLRCAWLYCCKKAGIGNYRIHDIRHWAVTKLLMAGNTERDVASVAGWKDTTMIKVYYLSDGRRSARSITF